MVIPVRYDTPIVKYLLIDEGLREDWYTKARRDLGQRTDKKRRELVLDNGCAMLAALDFSTAVLHTLLGLA